MSTPRHGESGFTLLELLIAVAVMLLVLAGTSQIMSSAMDTSAAARDVLDMNSHLRAGMDLIQRDLMQVGQGLPVGRRVGVPNGSGAAPINRPGPPAQGACAGVTTFPDEPSLPAVQVGAGVGPEVNGACTDVITVLAADSMFGPVPLAAMATNGSTAIVHNSANISDNPDAAGDNLRAGDLLMLTKGAMSVLLQVTAVAGQQVTFGSGDPLGLNQLDPSLTIAGTVNQLRALAPLDPVTPVMASGVQQPGPTTATRIRMVTYFVDTTTTPGRPRLMRQVGGGQANAVAIGLDGFRLSYDIADQNSNPTAVRMDAADLGGSGACSPDPCSSNQIRKVNVLLSMTTRDDNARRAFDHGRQAQNTLFGQVSLRSMAFVDRYR